LLEKKLETNKTFSSKPLWKSAWGRMLQIEKEMDHEPRSDAELA
jgi:hypothetical protein